MTDSVKKTAIITGASGGIGGEVARRLVRDGFGVVIHYAGKPAPAQAVVAELKAAGGQAISPAAQTTSPMPVPQQTKHASLNTKRVLTRVSRTMCSRVSPP